MAELSIQPSINDLRSQSLLVLIERLGALDLTQILVYQLDLVPDSALMLLAWQFDILAPQWQLGADPVESIDALTNIDTLSSARSSAGVSDFDSWRTLLKAAIPLHRTRGTPYAIKTALASLGWNSVALLEGQASWGGTAWPASQGWAVFRVLINLAGGQVVTGRDVARMVAAVNFFKPVRALLDSLWFTAAPIGDAAPTPTDFLLSIFVQNDAVAPPLDIIGAPAWPVSDTKTIAPLYNCHFYHAGVTYGADEPVVADSGLTVNGTAISASG
jgi:P2-related tail formation protein